MANDLLAILLRLTLVSSAAILVVLAFRNGVRRRFGARTAYALWALPLVSMSALLLPAPVVTDTPSPGTGAVVQTVVRGAANLADWSGASHLDAVAWLAGAWLVGIVAALSAFAWQQRRFEQRLGRLTPTGADLLRAQTTVGCPALVGAWNPRIVLPADFEQRYSAAERELILAHERMHCRRGDALANGVFVALRCLFWFNPLIHGSAARFRFDQELACDAAVLAHFPQARKPYASAMLKAQLAFDGLPLGCHWQAAHPLKDRIAQITRPLPGRSRRVAGALVAGAVVALGTLAAWAAQPARHEASVSLADAAPTLSGDLRVLAIEAAPPPQQPQEEVTPPRPAARDDAPVAPPVVAPEPRRAAPAPTRAAVTPAASADATPAPAPAAIPQPPRVADAFIPPRVTQHWRPPYPADAYSAGAEGESQVLVTIAADGTLKDARVVGSSRNVSLDEASVAAARHYRYAPALRAGAAVEAQALVSIEWSINPGIRMTVASGLGRSVTSPGLPDEN